jgi:DNA end-binding protein Ku
MPRPLSGAVISFGLVTIPVRLYSATRSLAPGFHLVHRECGTRIREQLYCPKHERVVSREELVRGYEIAKDRYVTFTHEELEALEATGPRSIDIQQFVPLRTVDPIYFESTAYLGPDRNGDKPFRLLAEVMRDRDEVALGTFVARGKESLVAVRTFQGGLVLHHLYFADEVRDYGEIDTGKGPARREELKLALRLVEALKRPAFDPKAFEDTYRARVEKAAREKARGKPVREEPAAAPRGAVVDLMDALQKSLAGGNKRKTAGRRAASRGARRSAATPVRLKAG